MIGCTQPRRVAAVSVARRVAAERGETCDLSGLSRATCDVSPVGAVT